MISVSKWIKIIGKILILIGEGMGKDEAVSKVAREFNISESEIWEHGGF